MKNPEKFKIALIQMRMSSDPSENLSRAARKVEEAVAGGAEMVCLPELFGTPYFCQREDAGLFDLAETIPGPSTETFTAVARAKNVVILVPVFERRAPGLCHNSVVVIDSDGRIVGMYRKMHIPDDPGYYEKFYFTPGDLGFNAFGTRCGRIGTLICWDQWYPEAARLVALQGAAVIFYPTAIGWLPHEKAEHGPAQREAWRTVQRGHAIANGLYVAVVNRIGLEKPEPEAEGIEFWGSSFVADPQGVVVAEASANREEILHATVDLRRIEEIRRNWPFLRDRRIDAYQGITSRFLDKSETP